MTLQEDVVAKFFYDDGELIRRETIDNCRIWRAGSVIGTKDKDGYVVARFRGKQWKLHHMVWLYHYGYKPTMIDHINRDPSDNRIENLREANKSINAFNTDKPSNNTSGYKGVSWDAKRNKWHAYIGVKKAGAEKARKHLGYHEIIEDAIDARLAEEKKMGI